MKVIVPLQVVIDRLPEDLRKIIKIDMKVKGATVIRKQTTVPSQVEAAKRSALIYLSTRHVDMAGDIVTPQGWNLKYYDPSPRGLWSHNSSLPPIFKANWTKADDLGLQQHITFAETEFAEDIWKLFSGGFINTFSAGFKAESTGVFEKGMRDFDSKLIQYSSVWPELKDTAKNAVRIIEQKMLFESSLVNMPCNPYAMAIAIEKGDCKVTDETKQVLKVDEIIKKGVDSGELSKDEANGGKLIFTSIKEKIDDTEDKKPVDDKTADELVQAFKAGSIPGGSFDACVLMMTDKYGTDGAKRVCAAICDAAKEKKTDSKDKTKTAVKVLQNDAVRKIAAVHIIYTPESIQEMAEKKSKIVIAKMRGSV